jgi:hypothetical protein
MTLNAHRRRDLKRTRCTRVLLDGVDVTNRCFYADGRRGVVRMYKLNLSGQKYLEPIINAPHWDVPRRIATEEKRGHVRWGGRHE